MALAIWLVNHDFHLLLGSLSFNSILSTLERILPAFFIQTMPYIFTATVTSKPKPFQQLIIPEGNSHELAKTDTGMVCSLLASKLHYAFFLILENITFHIFGISIGILEPNRLKLSSEVSRRIKWPYLESNTKLKDTHVYVHSHLH